MIIYFFNGFMCNGSNLIVLDADVAREPSIASAINDTSTQDHDIKCFSRSLWSGSFAERG